MKGTIVSAWIKTCDDLYGENITDQALTHVGMSTNRVFRPTEDIEDAKAIGFIQGISKQMNIPIDELWEIIGRNNIINYSTRYPAFFKYDNLYSFLRSMYDIHVVVTENIPGSKPPILNVEPVDDYTVHMTYDSSRKMFSFFLGMLNGAADFFGESIDVSVLERNLSFESEVKTNDMFEDINGDINLVRDDLRKNFIGYKGTTDELNVFADNFNLISENMGRTSQDVYDIMSNLSQDTSTQSEEITNSANTLKNSIGSLNQVDEPPPLNFYQNLKSGFLISLLELSASLIGITAPHLRRH